MIYTICKIYNNIHCCTIFMAYSISSEVVLKMFFAFCSFHWMEPLMFPKKTESSAVRLAMAPTDSNCNLHKDSTTFFLCTRIFLGGFKPYHHLWWFFSSSWGNLWCHCDGGTRVFATSSFVPVPRWWNLCSKQRNCKASKNTAAKQGAW